MLSGCNPCNVLEVNSVHGSQCAWKYAGDIDAPSVHFFLNCCEHIQQVASKFTIIHPLAMSKPPQKSSVECIYIILLHRFLTQVSPAVSHRKPCVSLVFRLRTVPADASMTIKFASQSVIVIHCISLALISFVPGITKHISSIYEPNYHAVQLTPCQWSTMYTS